MEIILKDYFRIFEKNKREVKPGLTTNSFDLNPGLTFIAGCNGAGKSTLLTEIKSNFEESQIPFKYLDCRKSFHFSDISHIGKEFDTANAVSGSFRSEHEHYETMFQDWVGGVRPKDEAEKVGIFIDGLDSGGDVIFYKKHLALFNLIADDCAKRNIECYLVVTCNNFYYLVHSPKGELIFAPSLRKQKLPAYEITEFGKYEEDIRTSAKDRNYSID